jgi:two-component system, chemotaxis family, CheB/CheR fusion protein
MKWEDLDPTATISWRPDGTIHAWNDAATDLYGILEQDAVGQAHVTLLHTEFPVEWAHIEQRLAEGGTWSGRVNRTSRHGEVLEVFLELTARRGPDGLLIRETSRPATPARSLDEQLAIARTVATELEHAFARLLGEPLLRN